MTMIAVDLGSRRAVNKLPKVRYCFEWENGVSFGETYRTVRVARREAKKYAKARGMVFGRDFVIRKEIRLT